MVWGLCFDLSLNDGPSEIENVDQDQENSGIFTDFPAAEK